MAHSFGVFLRSNTYYLRVMLPKEHPLLAHYKSGKVVTRLKAASFRDAQLEGIIKRAEILSNQFLIPAAKQQGQNPKLTNKCYLRDIFDKWLESKPRSNDSINSCKRSLRLYEEYTLNPFIKDITRTQGDGFRSWLQHPDRKTSSKTAKDRFVWVNSLLNYATMDLELLSKNPWQGIHLKYSTTQKRRPWTDSELQTLFSSEIFTNHQIPKDWRAGEKAACWIPLLGLYTGARVGELSQLQVDDIQIDQDISCIEITNVGIGQHLKTDSSRRKIPIHSKLIELGFIEYVQTIKKENHTSLWPKLPTRINKAGGYFSNWFGEYRAKINLKGYPDFHCLRHTVRTKLAEADISEHLIDIILGHEIRGSTGARIYSHRTISSLKNAIELITYPSTTKLLKQVGN